MLLDKFMKLGKLEPKVDERTLQLSNYISKLANAPASFSLTQKITNLGMMLNDSLGDCTCATVGHIIQQWTAEASKQVLLTDAQIVSLYQEVSGYKPGYPSTDNGAVVLDVLNYWRKNGVFGHSLTAYASLNSGHVQQAKDAIYYFGNAYLGVALPLSAQSQDIWDVPVTGTKGKGKKGSWGGHAIPIVSYDKKYVTCITWGAYKKMTWSFYTTYCDEAYALLSPDWIESIGKCPADFDLNALLADLKTITSA